MTQTAMAAMGPPGMEPGAGISPEALAIINESLQQIQHRAGLYRLYRDYYDGRQRMGLARKDLERIHRLFGHVLDDFRENLCGIPVDALADRLRLEGFERKDTERGFSVKAKPPAPGQGPGLELEANGPPPATPGLVPPDTPPQRDNPGTDSEPPSADDAAALPEPPDPQPEPVPRPAPIDPIEQAFGDLLGAIGAFWHRNKLDVRQGEVVQDMAMVGDSYVLVWPHPDTSLATAYQIPAELMHVRYDPERPGTPEWACKVWCEDVPIEAAAGITLEPRLRATIYYPDRLEKYLARAEQFTRSTTPADWEPFQDEGDTAWPILHNGQRVPVFHFPNNRSSVRDVGRSELVDLVPVQDALNRSIIDMLCGMVRYGWPQRYIAARAAELDETTGAEREPLASDQDDLWEFYGESATVGQFEPADLDKLLNVQAAFERKAALVTRTPAHWYAVEAGGWPSGESLKTAEAPFLVKVGDRRDTAGPVWEDLCVFAARMDGYAGDTVELAPIWREDTAAAGPPMAAMAAPGVAPAATMIGPDGNVAVVQGELPRPGPPKGVTPPQLRPFAARVQRQAGQ